MIIKGVRLQVVFLQSEDKTWRAFNSVWDCPLASSWRLFSRKPELSFLDSLQCHGQSLTCKVSMDLYTVLWFAQDCKNVDDVAFLWLPLLFSFVLMFKVYYCIFNQLGREGGIWGDQINKWSPLVVQNLYSNHLLLSMPKWFCWRSWEAEIELLLGFLLFFSFSQAFSFYKKLLYGVTV